jgi:hypothetical protein
MKEKDEGLDDLFRKGLEDPVNEAAYREADWDAMEQMLDKPKRRPAIIYWLPIIGSAAALVLIFLGWLLLRPVVVKPQHEGQLAKTPHPVTGVTGSTAGTKVETKEATGISGGPARQTAGSNSQKLQAPANYAKNMDAEGHGRKNKSFFTLSAGAGRRNTTGMQQNNAGNKQPEQTLATNPEKKSDPANATTDQSIAANNTPNITTPQVQTNAAQADTSGKKLLADNTKPLDVKQVKAAVKSRSGYRPQFAIGVIASSDLNGVNSSFQQSKIGGNFGLVLSMGLSKKWTISAGASYDIKPYLTGIGNYHTNYVFPTEPVSVSANCRMLEVPINVNYQVYAKHNNKISIGTGLSSYFMLREDYTFNYDEQYATGPAGFSVINKNRNILSIVNLDATYQHQVNSRVGIIIQPYLKIPLSNVGESQVRLQTSGVAAGVSWNINSLTKK